MSNRDELAGVLYDKFEVETLGEYDACAIWATPAEAADKILAAGYRKIFDGDCGLSHVEDPTDREAAEAWMRFSNLVLGDHDGIAAMKRMLTELGYRKVTA